MTNQKKWFNLLIMSTAYIAVFANTQGFSALFPFVQEEFNISRAHIGLYPSFYHMSTTLIAVFSGRFIDYIGTKRGLILGVSVVGLMMILHSFSPYFGIILILAFFTGVAFSLITPSVYKGVFELVEPNHRSVSIGITHSIGGFGGFMGAVMLPFIGNMVGWRIAILFSSITAVLIALFIFTFYQVVEIPQDKQAAFSRVKPISLKKDLLFLMRNSYLLSIFSMGIVIGMSISSVTGHFSLYLTIDLGYSTTLAGFGLGIFHFGGILGMPCCGLINEKIFRDDKRIGIFLLGIFIASLYFFFGLVANFFLLPSTVIFILSFLLGFSALGLLPLYFTAASEQVPIEYIGIVTGLALIFPRASTVFSPPLFGLIADLSGSYSNSWIIVGIIVIFLSFTFLFSSGIHSLTSANR